MTETQSPQSFRTASLPPEQSLAALAPPRLAERLRAIQHVTDAVLSPLTLDELLDTLMPRLREMLAVDAVCVLLGPSSENQLTLRGALGPDAVPARLDDPGTPTAVLIGQGIAGWVAREQRAVIVDEVARVPDTAAPLRGLHSAMAVPLAAAGRTVGVLAVGTTTPRVFGEADLACLQLVGERVGLAMDRAERVENALGLDRPQAERTLLDEVLRQMPAGVLIAEAPSGRVVRGNPRIESILRHPIVGPDGMEDYRQWTGWYPDGRPVQPSEWPLARAIQHGHTVTGEEILFQRGDGTRGWLRLNAAPIRDAAGRIVAGVVVFHDIDRERRAIEDLRFLAEVGDSLQSSLDYRITLRNVVRLAVPRFADWCMLDLVDARGRPHRQETAHHDPAREARMRELQQRFPTDLRDERNPIGRVLRTGAPLLVAQRPDRLLDELADDPEHREILRAMEMNSVMIVPLRGHSRTLGVMTFVAAESRRRYTEDDLALAEEVARRSALAIENAELYAAASEANRAKMDFLAVMSHELRTPLAAVMGYAELLQMGIPERIPEGAMRQVERIDSSARQLLQLIEEILTFSRLNEGQEPVTRDRVDLSAPVGEAVAFIRSAAEKKGLALHVEVPTEPVRIETDGSKVRQILMNLLFNAVQFTADGEIRVTLEPEPDAVRLHVEDSGIGIAREDQEKIFDAFWQVRQGSTREVGGTGLGLTVAQRIAHLLGGEITVHSALGEGSTFTLTLPITSPAAGR